MKVKILLGDVPTFEGCLGPCLVGVDCLTGGLLKRFKELFGLYLIKQRDEETYQKQS